MSLLLLAYASQLAIWPASAAPAVASNGTMSTFSLNDIPLTSPFCQDINKCRSLYSIISSCVGTLFICVFVAVHRNVQSPKNWGFGLAGEALGTLIAPEYALAMAINQFLNARILARRLEAARAGRGDHARGGSKRAKRVYQSEEERKLMYSGRDDELVYTALAGAAWKMSNQGPSYYRPWTVTHAFFVVADGFWYFDENDQPVSALTPDDVLDLVKQGTLIPPTLAELEDRGKADAISKTVAVVQTLWFIIQCAARRVERLPMTQLEIMTLAYTAIAMIMYGFWWNKPLNVACPIRVPVVARAQGPSDPYRPDKFKGHSSYVPYYIVTLAIVLFGAIHCAAWSYPFPTKVERDLWRASSLFATGVLVVPVLLMLVCGTHDAIIWIPMILYVAARLILLGLSFSTLRSLAPEVYQAVSWTQFIPHI
ncbi:hypothetical protein HWV62_17068 [Athelia sp. TMB]|nr:hypothetical protein HWV62_17068 [Athelia sp. TMB]